MPVSNGISPYTDSNKDHLSSGAIAGIVVGCVVLVILIVIITVVLRNKSWQINSHAKQTAPNTTTTRTGALPGPQIAVGYPRFQPNAQAT